MQKLTRKYGWHIREVRRKPITAWGRQITPISRLFQLNLPRVAIVWHRPIAVEVRQGDAVQRLPVRGNMLTICGANPLVTVIVLTGLVIAGASPLLQRIRSRRRSVS
jgi:hypothetical protein